jgi:RimJ/RimL family protein N-acetyltransferase
MVASTAPAAARDEGAGALIVRQWGVEDAPLLHEAVTESIEHLRPWMPWIADEPVTVEQRRERIAGWRALWDEGDRLFGMFVGEAVVGGCGLHARIGPGGLEIGYWVRVGHTGRGYATEAARQLTDIAFATPGIDRVEIRHDATNAASSRVPAKLGYVRTEDLHRPPVAPGETGVDHVWRMTRAAWVADAGESA